MATESTVVEPESETPVVPEAFAVRDASSANWLVRRIVEARRYADHVRAWAAVEIRRAEREEQFFLQHYGHQLEEWARAELSVRGGRRRSIGLPAGTIGFRREHPHLVIQDEKELTAWCRANLVAALVIQINASGRDAEKFREFHRATPTLATVSESLCKLLLQRHVRDTGECPDGAEIACGDNFYIK